MTQDAFSDRDQQTLLNEDEDDQMSMESYRLCRARWYLTWLAIMLSVGVLRIIFYWKPIWMLYCTHRRCHLNVASIVLLTDKYQQKYAEKIIDQDDNNNARMLMPRGNGTFVNVNRMRHFSNKKTHYVWDEQRRKFIKLVGLDYHCIRCDTLHAHTGLSESHQNKRLALFGPNVITIRVMPIVRILFSEVLNPFYIYQALAILFWTLDEYYYYSIYIVLMSIVSLVITTYKIRTNQSRLHNKVHGSGEVVVYRGSALSTETIDTSRLVPGDVFIVHNSELYCDAVLLNGEAIVDESMLTGESNPVTKTSIRNSTDIYKHRLETRHTLFSGTRVMQCTKQNGKPPRAVVIRTNLQTAKGELVRSILYPKPVDFKFNQHLYLFMAIMGLLALAGFIYTITVKSGRNDPLKETIFKALDLITVIVPPELPAALTIAIVFSEQRLKKINIFCMSPRSINISGCTDCVVFDKTGTLTEDIVDLEESLLASNQDCAQFQPPIKCINALHEDNILKQCLALCHSLKVLNGQFIGDNLDVKLFQSTGCCFQQDGELSIVDCGEYRFRLLKLFPFSSSTARMAVIAREDRQFKKATFFIKGAPEVIAKFCKQETIPSSFDAVLKSYAQRSYRVLGLAYKNIEITNLDVENTLMTDYEHQLTFIGLVALRNKLKPDTLETINTLNEANLRIIMATGDNIVTAISVAEECNILQASDQVIILDHLDHLAKPRIRYSSYQKQTQDNLVNDFSIDVEPKENYKLAMNGATFQVIRDHYPQLMNFIAGRGFIYARMLPEQKQQLIEALQHIGHFVAMCGDGANDCGALKAAHAGLSLSDTEASVASPFTSITGTVSSVVHLVMEGRASLTSVSGVIRYMLTYNITTFLAYCILYYFYSALTDVQNIYHDVAVNSLNSLSRIAPPSSLIGIPQFASIILQLVLVAIFQSCLLVYVHHQAWFKPHDVTLQDIENKHYECHDNLTMFGILNFQYMILCIIFSKGAPFRQPFHKNRLLLLAMSVVYLVSLYLVIIPDKPFKVIAEQFGIYHPDYPLAFRLLIALAALIQLALATVAENVVVEKGVAEWARKRSKTMYDRIYSQTCTSLDWIHPTE